MGVSASFEVFAVVVGAFFLASIEASGSIVDSLTASSFFSFVRVPLTFGIEPSLGLLPPPNFGEFSALLPSSDFLFFRSDFRSSFLASSLVSTFALEDSSLTYGLTTVELPGLPSAALAGEFPGCFSYGFSAAFASSFFSYTF